MKWAKLKLEPVIKEDDKETVLMIKALKSATIMQKFIEGESSFILFPHYARDQHITDLWEYIEKFLPEEMNQSKVNNLYHQFINKRREYSEKKSWYSAYIPNKKRLYPGNFKNYGDLYNNFLIKVHKKRGSPSKRINGGSPSFENFGYRRICYFIYRAPNGKVMLNCKSRKRGSIL